MLKMLSAALNDFSDLLRSGSGARRLLFFTGLLLMGSGLFHMGVFIWEKGTWEGPLSWRKPILFGLSGGVTMLSVGWVVSLVVEKVPRDGWMRWLEPWFCTSFSFCMLAEVGLITLQTWRGEASHFNESTRLNSFIFYLIGIFTIYGACAITALTIIALGTIPGPLDRALAVRFGMIFLVLEWALGYWILQYGVKRVHEGLSPETYGEHGIMKFPHGLPLHSIQYLALQSWLMRFAKLPLRWRAGLIISSAAGLLLITIFGSMQTLDGKARFDLTFESAIILVLSVLLFALPFVATGLKLASHSIWGCETKFIKNN